MSELAYWLGFSLIHDVGTKKIKQLQDHFGSLQSAWNAPVQELRELGWSYQAIQDMQNERSKLNLEHELRRVELVKAFLLCLADSNYPPSLRVIDSPPAILYVRGTLHDQDSRAICVVGTRKATSYGREIAYRFSHDLAQLGYTIIGGLSDGIEAAAHRGALDAGGRTIAVLPSGINHVYPYGNETKQLAHRIIEHGCVLSEFRIGAHPQPSSFTRRNRLMSGMAKGVLVVEAGETSGALNTASHAIEQGREVFAIPHNILHKDGIGCNKLIQDGAKLVRGIEDIIDEIPSHSPNALLFAPSPSDSLDMDLSETEQQILDLLGANPIHVDDLARSSQLPISDVMSTLTILELNGLAQSVGNMLYVAYPTYL
ncbi:MAG UNVERIFIED_CONTAM: DNA-processing protein DprA [Anaerolineae bacterium]